MSRYCRVYLRGMDGVKSMKEQDAVPCQICREKKVQTVPARTVPAAIAEVIRGEHPDWSTEGFICMLDLNLNRTQYIAGMLEKERGEVARLEERVERRKEDMEFISWNISTAYDENLTTGHCLADRLPDFAGSWLFIGLFLLVMAGWIAINPFLLLSRPIDPYSFILLSLILSCIAAIQAPAILMSQKRENRDRLRAEQDYQVNEGGDGDQPSA